MRLPPSNKHELSTRDSIFCGILGTLFVGIFIAGLTDGLTSDNQRTAIGLIMLGAFGVIGMAVFLYQYRLKITHALIAAIGVLIATWIFLAYVIWTKPKEVIVHDPPTAEDIARATAPLQKELDAKTQALTTVTTDRDAEKQRADSATQQLAAYQTQFPTLQANLASVTTERDNFHRSLEETISELNATRAQLGPPSRILALDDAKRWQVFTAMQEATTDIQGRHIECKSVNSLDQTDLAAALHSELVELISRAWPGGNAQGFPPPPHQPFGITFVVNGHSGNAFECASRLVGALQNILGTSKVPIVLRTGQESENLAKCNNECVEIRYGGER
jgi:hypothetical protein